MNFIAYIIDRIKASIRKEIRVAPRNARGRVYSKSSSGDNVMSTKSKGKLIIKMRVFRAATGKWENINNG